MSKKIETILRHSLLKDGKMDIELYHNNLEEIIDDLKESLIDDDEDYIFSLACEGTNVAMIMIDMNGKIYINEDARTKLKSLWLKNYNKNLSMFIPKFAYELHKNIMPITGFSVVGNFRA